MRRIPAGAGLALSWPQPRTASEARELAARLNRKGSEQRARETRQLNAELQRLAAESRRLKPQPRTSGAVRLRGPSTTGSNGRVTGIPRAPQPAARAAEASPVGHTIDTAEVYRQLNRKHPGLVTPDNMPAPARAKTMRDLVRAAYGECDYAGELITTSARGGAR